MSDYDPAVMDPLQVDTEPPPFRDLFKIESGGDQMNARLYVAQGPGLHPTEESGPVRGTRGECRY